MHLTALILSLSLAQSTPPSESEDQASNPYADAECWTSTAIGQAPHNVDLQLELEPTYAMEEGLYFPASTALYALWKLTCLEMWPEMAQAKLDEQAQRYDFLIASRDDTIAQLQALPPVHTGPSWWTVIGVGAGAVAAGLVIGFVAHGAL